jgi:ribonuclease P protein component
MQAGVTVSSRNFKKAVERNRVKRILREAYRVQKLPLQHTLKKQDRGMILFFIYIGKELPSFNEVNDNMHTLVQRLSTTVSKNV